MMSIFGHVRCFQLYVPRRLTNAIFLFTRIDQSDGAELSWAPI